MDARQATDISLLIRAIRSAPRRILGASLLAGGITWAACSFLPQFYCYEALVTTPKLADLQNLAQNPKRSLGILAPSLAKDDAAGAHGDIEALIPAPPPLNEDVESLIRFKYVDRPRSRFDHQPYLVAIADAGEDSLAYLQMIIYARDLAEAETLAKSITGEIDRYFMSKIAAIEATFDRARALLGQELASTSRSLQRLQGNSSAISPVLLMLESSLKKDKVQLEQTISAYRAAISGLNTHGAALLLTKSAGKIGSPKTLTLSLAVAAATFLVGVLLATASFRRARPRQESSREA